MSEAKEVEVKAKKSVSVESLQAQVNDLSAKVRRMAGNWKRFAAVHLGSDEHDDGKLHGFGTIKELVLLGVLALAIPLCVYAATTIWDIGSTANGTCTVTSTSGAMTLTVDKIVADGAGLTAVPSGAITSLSAAKLQAGTAATAINGAAITNINAANVSGALPATITVGAYSPTVASGTTKTMIQSGSATSLQVIAFSPVYSGAPRMTCSIVGPSTHNMQISTLNATNAVITDLTAQDVAVFNWIAVGTTP